MSEAAASFPTTATHWGTYRGEVRDGRLVALHPYEGDPDPSPIARNIPASLSHSARIRRPAVRRAFLEKGPAAGGEGRGAEPFVEVGWDTALDLVAAEVARVRGAHGNAAIFGGSYGWSSAGRFHHAQSQLHRFLNCAGGFTRSVNSYSYAAAQVIVPRVLGDSRGLLQGHTSWSSIAEHAGLVLMFGGMPLKNAQVDPGGTGRHVVKEHLLRAKTRGARFVLLSPLRGDALEVLDAEWLLLRPSTDAALMLGLAHTLVAEGLHDRAFLDRYTVGFGRFEAYLLGHDDGRPKDAEWAAAITGLDARRICSLAREMAAAGTMISVSWSVQRTDHGEQPYWLAITLAAMLGQIGLPGVGFGFGYAAVNGVGSQVRPFPWPSLPQGRNQVESLIPVARISDMLLHPSEPFDFDGRRLAYPDIRLVWWAGGNPFHHHQDLNRLVRAWKRPETVVVNEIFWNALAKHADIVLPATTSFERDDIACTPRDDHLVAMHRLVAPVGEARDDYVILAGVAERLGVREAFTEGRSEEDWLRWLYNVARQRAAERDMDMPEFADFWAKGVFRLPPRMDPHILMADFRADPADAALPTPSGRIEISSETIASFGYDDCPGHPVWLEPAEWLGAPLAERHPLHLVSNQPVAKLHSQYDLGPYCEEARIGGREMLRIHPADAAPRGIATGDVVRVFNDRGACLAAALVTEEVMPRVVVLPTGAWYDPLEPGVSGTLEVHGNPNVLTLDKGSSKLAQAPVAHSCLVEVEPFAGEAPRVAAFDTPPRVMAKTATVGKPAASGSP
jgi:biotin/methionine sulfoxide reductase